MCNGPRFSWILPSSICIWDQHSNRAWYKRPHTGRPNRHERSRKALWLHISHCGGRLWLYSIHRGFIQRADVRYLLQQLCVDCSPEWRVDQVFAPCPQLCQIESRIEGWWLGEGWALSGWWKWCWLCIWRSSSFWSWCTSAIQSHYNYWWFPERQLGEQAQPCSKVLWSIWLHRQIRRHTHRQLAARKLRAWSFWDRPPWSPH